MTNKRRRDSGFTLIELLVVVLIIGILAAVAVPSYLKSVETTKADDAVALINMVGTTNKMYALDHKNGYAAGHFTASCGTTGACPAGGGTQTNPCVLVRCGYLVDQDWANKSYAYYACNGGVSAACAGLGSGQYLSAARRSGGSAPYSSWGYTMSLPGTISVYNGAPSPTY